MHARLTISSKGLLRGAEEPTLELGTAIRALYLFVVLCIVHNKKVGSLAFPKPPANSLLRPTAEDAKAVPISHLDDNVSSGVNFKLSDPKLSDDVFVSTEFLCNVTELLGGKLFGGADEDHVVRGAEENFG